MPGLDPGIQDHHDPSMSGWVYILASQVRGTLYIGVTNSLVRRVQEHREGLNPRSFTNRYDVRRLVYYEEHATMPLAIAREKVLKHWTRRRKLELITAFNPDWRDLWPDIAAWA